MRIDECDEPSAVLELLGVEKRRADLLALIEMRTDAAGATVGVLIGVNPSERLVPLESSAPPAR